MPLLSAKYSAAEAIEGGERVRLLDAPVAPFESGRKPLRGHKRWGDWEKEPSFVVPTAEQMRIYVAQAVARNATAPDFRKPTQEQLEERLEAARAHAQAKQEDIERAKRKAQLEQITRGLAGSPPIREISDTRAREIAPPAKVVPVDVRPRAWVDIETTGSDASKHQIIELGLLVLEADNRTPRLHWSTLVQLGVGFAVDERALDVSGLDPRSEMFRDAPALRPALRYLAERLPSDAIVCGHNLSFDLRFLRAQFGMVKLDLPPCLAVDAPSIDTLTIARAAQKRGAFAEEEAKLPLKNGKSQKQSCSLGDLADLFNARRVKIGKHPFDPTRAPAQAADKHGRVADEHAATTKHRALADARFAAFLYVELLGLSANDNTQPQLALAVGGGR